MVAGGCEKLFDIVRVHRVQGRCGNIRNTVGVQHRLFFTQLANTTSAIQRLTCILVICILGILWVAIGNVDSKSVNVSYSVFIFLLAVLLLRRGSIISRTNFLTTKTPQYACKATKKQPPTQTIHAATIRDQWYDSGADRSPNRPNLRNSHACGSNK